MIILNDRIANLGLQDQNISLNCYQNVGMYNDHCLPSPG